MCEFCGFCLRRMRGSAAAHISLWRLCHGGRSTYNKFALLLVSAPLKQQLSCPWRGKRLIKRILLKGVCSVHLLRVPSAGPSLHSRSRSSLSFLSACVSPARARSCPRSILLGAVLDLHKPSKTVTQKSVDTLLDAHASYVM